MKPLTLNQIAARLRRIKPGRCLNVDASFNGVRSTWKEVSPGYIRTYMAVDSRFRLFSIRQSRFTQAELTASVLAFGKVD